MKIRSLTRMIALSPEEKRRNLKRLVVLLASLTVLGSAGYAFRANIASGDEALQQEREKRRRETPLRSASSIEQIPATQTPTNQANVLQKNLAGDFLKNSWSTWFATLGSLIGLDGAIVELRAEEVERSSSPSQVHFLMTPKSVRFKIQLEVRDDNALAAILDRFSRSTAIENVSVENAADIQRNAERFVSVRIQLDMLINKSNVLR
jgi:hypothetical protein